LTGASAARFPRRALRPFIFLIAAQAAHSLEEYLTGLYEVLRPAAAVSSMFSADPETGFLMANALLVAAGLSSLAFVAKRPGAAAVALASAWAVLETLNGLGHIGLSLAQGAYFSGAATAPLLLLASGWLVASLRTRVRGA
jgi:hypothetical protein